MFDSKHLRALVRARTVAEQTAVRGPGPQTEVLAARRTVDLVGAQFPPVGSVALQRPRHVHVQEEEEEEEEE